MISTCSQIEALHSHAFASPGDAFWGGSYHYSFIGTRVAPGRRLRRSDDTDYEVKVFRERGKKVRRYVGTSMVFLERAWAASPWLRRLDRSGALEASDAIDDLVCKLTAELEDPEHFMERATPDVASHTDVQPLHNSEVCDG